ncbi:MAG: DUF4157 domain-containing protein [Geminicoccaceae bacterium]|nr:MAG: DUF4157 domain-containing protein [Geminicoccaceae bacterium]
MGHDGAADLRLGSARDADEAVADRLADAALQHLTSAIGTPPPSERPPAAPPTGRGRGRPLHPATAKAVARVTGRAGEPLAPALRADLEPAFGTDLGDVRIHRDVAAAASARSLHAHAYTVGPHVVFGQGRFAPATPAGTRLLAHEIGHVLQQRGASNMVQRYCATLDECAANPMQVRQDLVSELRWVLVAAAVDGWEEATADVLTTAAAIVLPAYHDTEGGAVTARIYAVAQRLAAVTQPHEGGGSIDIVDALFHLQALHEDAHAHPALAGARPSFGLAQAARAAAEDMSWAFVSIVPGIDDYTNMAIVMLEGTLTALAAALTDPIRLLELELEGAIAALLESRAAVLEASDADERAARAAEIPPTARLAVLLSQTIAARREQAEPGAPLETALQAAAGEMARLRTVATSETSTLKALGGGAELLGEHRLRLEGGVAPHLLDVGGAGFLSSAYTPEGDLGVALEPAALFPETLDATTDRFIRSVLNEVTTAQADVERLRRDLVPEQFELDDFALAFRRWYDFFSREQEQTDPVLRMLVGMLTDTYVLWGSAVMSPAAQAQGAFLRAFLMQHFVSLMAASFGFGATSSDFAGRITALPLRRRETVSGEAERLGYRSAEMFEPTRTPGFSAGASRTAARDRAASTSRMAASRVLRARPAERPAAAVAEGLAPTELPVLGMSAQTALADWNYLIDVADLADPDRRTIAREHKAVDEQVAEYLMSVRQLHRTVHTAHRPQSGPGQPIGERAMRAGGIEEATGTTGAAMVAGSPAGMLGVGMAPSARAEALAAARERAERVLPHGSSEGQAVAGALGRLLNELEAYFARYFERRAGDPAYIVAAVLVMADRQFGLHGQFQQMLSAENIRKVMLEAAKIITVTTTLNALGPVGRLLSRGYQASNNIRGEGDVSAIIGLSMFIRDAASARSFNEARAWSYMANIVMRSVHELFESLISRPMSAAVQAVIQRPPSTAAELAHAARRLLPPDAQARFLADVELRIGELEAQGARRRSDPELRELIIVRDELRQQTSRDRAELDIVGDVPLTRDIDPQAHIHGRVVPDAARRSEIDSALGGLRGEVGYVQLAEAGHTVRVRYGEAGIHLEIGREATARHIGQHLQTVRELRRHAGVVGAIRRLLTRVRALLQGRGWVDPRRMTRGDEARLEVAKLQRIEADLVQALQRFEEAGQRVADPTVQRRLQEELGDIRNQLVQHLRDVDSLERGRGLIAAEDRITPALQRAGVAEVDVPPGHYWRVAGTRLQLVNNTGTVRDPSSYDARLRPFVRRDSVETLTFQAKDWATAFNELGGNSPATPFGRFVQELSTLGVGPDVVIARMQETPGGRTRGSPEGLNHRTVRHDVKQHFIDTVVMPHILAGDPGRDVAGREAWAADSHRRMLQITNNLHAADRGSIGERWHQAVHGSDAGHAQVEVTAAQLRRQNRTLAETPRRLDYIEGDTITEVKNVEGPLGSRVERQIGDMIELVRDGGSDIQVGGEARRVRRARLVLQNPATLDVNANVTMLREALAEARGSLVVVIYNYQGQAREIRLQNIRDLDQPALGRWLGAPDATAVE